MTKLSATWYLDACRVIHICAPDVRTPWTEGVTCACGAPVPRRLRRFGEWMKEREVLWKLEAGKRSPVIARRISTRRSPSRLRGSTAHPRLRGISDQLPISR